MASLFLPHISSTPRHEPRFGFVSWVEVDQKFFPGVAPTFNGVTKVVQYVTAHLLR